MKILLYSEGLDKIKSSGLGNSGLVKAINHQIEALDKNNIEYTLDKNCLDYDIVHINIYTPDSLLFAKKAHRLGKKVVFHAHSTEEDFKNSIPFSNTIAPLFKKWISKCYKEGDIIITPTEYSKKLLETYDLKTPIYALSNGIDIDYFKRNEENGLKFRKKYGYSNEDKVILGIGLYYERKGILDFIELAKRIPEYKFIWFGYSPNYALPNNIKRALKTKLPNLQFPGYVTQDIIRDAYSGSDVFIFPTLEETEGIPLLEAIASKTNTIIRDIPVFDWVKDKQEVYKARNIDEFELLIKKIINKKVPSLTEIAYKKILDKDITKIGEKLGNIYRGIKMKNIKEIEQNQKQLNTSLAQVLENNGVKNLQLTSLGNSIAAGYSALHPVKPLLERNKTLTEIMKNHNITLTRKQFSRGQNNNDEHVFEWITTNITEEEMNRMNRNDFGNSKTSMNTVGITEETLLKYYPISPKENKGLQDIILDSKKDMANIVVYNCCTGSFLDGITRKGNIKQMLTYGIKRDTYGIESVLKFIQSNNRKNNTNTQIYLCGAPDYLGLKVTNVANNKLKKIADKYANVVYIPPVKAKLFYNNGIDIHYSEEEYLEFNNKIVESITNNYEVTKSMINIDREIYKFNETLELYKQEEVDNLEKTNNYIFYYLTKESSKLEPEKAIDFLNKARDYLKERSPYDFFYVGKNNIENSIQKAQYTIK